MDFFTSFNDNSIYTFNYDALCANPLASYLSMYDIQELYRIIKDPKLSSKLSEKVKLFDDLLKQRGFKRFSGGTNRMVYRHLEDTSIIIKVALREQGIIDNYSDYRNQNYLKPYVAKTFEVSPYGVVILCERVYPIRSLYDVESVWEDMFYLIVFKFIGKYVLDDIGSKYFKNYGIRPGFGLVLLDYSYVYEIDPDKLRCNLIIPETGEKCNGEIDYDSGFNRLICMKCGKQYSAKDLAKKYNTFSQVNNISIFDCKGEVSDMKIRLLEGDQVIKEVDTTKQTKVIDKEKLSRMIEKKQPKNEISTGHITLKYGNEVVADLDTMTNEIVKPTTVEEIARINNNISDNSVEQEEQPEEKIDVDVNKLKEQMQVNSIEINSNTIAGIPKEYFNETVEEIKDPDMELSIDDITSINTSNDYIINKYEAKYKNKKDKEAKRKARKNVNYDEF